MTEYDQDELLQCSDDESDTEDMCLPDDTKHQLQTAYLFTHTKLEFLVAKFTLILSSFLLLILQPFYLESINIRGNAYSLIFMSTFVTILILIILIAFLKYFCKSYRYIRMFNLPLPFTKLIQIVFVYFLSGFLIIYALDRNRILCHLQDPIKGILLVFSILMYFFCCRKFMGLQRIFSATTIIVGLFIAIDYGLCDAFRCRGYERDTIYDDQGIWSWKTHKIWTGVYIFGLACFTAYFTLLERYIFVNEMNIHYVNGPTAVLSTVSRSVSRPPILNTDVPSGNDQVLENNNLTQGKYGAENKFFVYHFALWIHIFGFIMVLALFWTDLIPELGKGANISEFWTYTTQGIRCHFVTSSATSDCGRSSFYAWLFIIAYVLFVISSIKFLILSQSAVYTVSNICAALPLIGIWWSLFYVIPDGRGALIWSPQLTGELVCSLLGLPIIFIGLLFFCKAHFKDWATTLVVLPNNNLQEA